MRCCASGRVADRNSDRQFSAIQRPQIQTTDAPAQNDRRAELVVAFTQLLVAGVANVGSCLLINQESVLVSPHPFPRIDMSPGQRFCALLPESVKRYGACTHHNHQLALRCFSSPFFCRAFRSVGQIFDSLLKFSTTFPPGNASLTYPKRAPFVKASQREYTVTRKPSEWLAMALSA